jgi:hypothetical protein
MTNFQTILEALCSSVSVLSSNETQTVFSLTTPKEAQLAYDLLIAHGFDVRVYHEPDMSKFYVNQPAAADTGKLAAALAYAHTLLDVVDSLDGSETADYKVSFFQSPGMGKQITITFPTDNAATTTAPTLQTVARPATPRPTTSPYSAARPRKVRRRSHAMMSGPAIAKKSMFVNKRGIRAWLHNYFVSNVAESFYAFILMFFLAIATVSILIASKGFLCPDIAHEKSNEWYCNISR